MMCQNDYKSCFLANKIGIWYYSIVTLILSKSLILK